MRGVVDSPCGSEGAPLLLADLLLDTTALLDTYRASPFTHRPMPRPHCVPAVILNRTRALAIVPGHITYTSTLPVRYLLTGSDGSNDIFRVPCS